MRDRIHRIYRIECPDGRAYIGCTVGLVDARISTHISAARGRYTCPKGGISDAINQFGDDSITWEQIASATSTADAAFIETLLIAQHGTLTPGGYNLRAKSAVPLHPRKGTRGWVKPEPVVRDWIFVKTTKCKTWPPKRKAA